MNAKEKSIKWLKGTCNYNLFKFYMQDIEVAIKIAIQEAKKELLDDWIRRLKSCLQDDAILPLAGQEFRDKVIEFIKEEKRHLSTFSDKKQHNYRLSKIGVI